MGSWVPFGIFEIIDQANFFFRWQTFLSRMKKRWMSSTVILWKELSREIESNFWVSREELPAFFNREKITSIRSTSSGKKTTVKWSLVWRWVKISAIWTNKQNKCNVKKRTAIQGPLTTLIAVSPCRQMAQHYLSRHTSWPKKQNKTKINTALVYTLFSFLLLIAVAMEITHKAQSFTFFFQGVVTKYKNGILLYTVLFALTHSVRERRQGAL